MRAANTRKTYGSVSKALHWATALLILTLLPLGFVAVAWPYDTSETLATKAYLFSVHKTLGVAVFFLALVRIAWALGQPRPAPLHPERRLETALAEGVHWLLYLSLVLVPLSGWVHHAATTGFAPIWWPFGQSLPFVPQSTAVADAAGALHAVFAKLLLAALALHVAGALKHHLIDRDTTLARMLPGRGNSPAEPAEPDATARHARSPIAAALGIYALVGIAVLLAVPAVDLGGAGAATQAGPASARAPGNDTWRVETGSLAFTVRSMGAPVTGRFGDWSADIVFTETPTPDDVHGTLDVLVSIESMSLGSVTSQARGPEFFNAATFPTARYEARIVATEQGYEARGTLDLAGARVPVTLPFTLAIDGDAATASGSVTVDRRAFGMGESYPDEATVGFSVLIEVALEATRGEREGAPPS